MARPEMSGYGFVMAAAHDLANLGKLIARHHGWPAAKAFKAYGITDCDQAAMTSCALEILKVFPPMPGACALMSAAFAVRLGQKVRAPVHVVAGTLTVEGVPVFGQRGGMSTDAFASGDLDWDGHVWVMVGPFIADISIFRTAYSPNGPPRLSRHVDLVFGPSKGLYVDHWIRTRKLGLGYEPHYVLSEAEVTALMGGAFQVIQENQAVPPS